MASLELVHTVTRHFWLRCLRRQSTHWVLFYLFYNINLEPTETGFQIAWKSNKTCLILLLENCWQRTRLSCQWPSNYIGSAIRDAPVWLLTKKRSVQSLYVVFLPCSLLGKLFAHQCNEVAYAQSWLSWPSLDWHLMGQQSKIILFGALHWTECYTPLSMDPFNVPCKGDMVCTRSVRKHSAVCLHCSGNCGRHFWKWCVNNSMVTGSLERNFPGHIWKMKIKCVTGNFVSVQLDGSLVGDSCAGLIAETISLSWSLFLHLLFFTAVRETDRPSITKILIELNCIWYTFLLVWNSKYF